MEFLERASFQETLTASLASASAATGVAVLVTGEAGIGKTTLLRRFADEHKATVRLLWGGCDSQFTPRALGPLQDMAEQAGGALGHLLADGTSKGEVLAGFLRELKASPQPNLVVIEDIHWADEATLDLLRYAARRVGETRTLLVATYRSDEVEGPLQQVLGDLARLGVGRLELPRLSRSAVAALARGHPADADALYRVTGGNPFFISEVLASPADKIPASVSDAVLARVRRLSPAGREVLEASAIIGTSVEVAVLDAVVGPSPPAVEECLTVGVLCSGGADLRFRHELARLAVEQAISAPRAKDLHARTLAAMATTASFDPARLAHHAEGAGAASAVLEHAPPAARRAATVGAHREAAAQYARALRFAQGLPPRELATLLEAYSWECHLTDQPDQALESAEQALANWAAADESVREAACHIRLSRLFWYRGRTADAHNADAAAMEILERFPAGPELASAFANRAQLAMLSSELDQAQRWGQRAIELARQLGQTETLAEALDTTGVAMLNAGDDHGRNLLEQSIQLATEAGLPATVSRGLNNLAAIAGNRRRPLEAQRYAQETLRHADANGTYQKRDFARGILAWALSCQGRWPEALQELAFVLESSAPPAVRADALALLGRIRARTGDADPWGPLDQAMQLFQDADQLDPLAGAWAARAEAAWLEGDQTGVVKNASQGLNAALGRPAPWSLGECGYWLWRGGAINEAAERWAEPYALMIAGEAVAAAAIWEERGCPFEQALALSQAPHENYLRRAFEIFTDLGSRPAAALVGRQMRQMGIKSIPRGRRPSTRSNRANLTSREIEVLQLMSEGLRNSDIAGRLFISTKTTDHHVSALMAKLEAHKRTQAVAKARTLGLLPPATG